ncbi:hypothetical protein [Cyclobacterium salsum]|uniref:hypothetical protein n=1 Tax=Cyclobacterium salsum TaxID=2666329 RepID=UPI0013918D16|nr:hypothetical protein [Cyclobacterium salsum]
MSTITLISTVHEEMGKCNADELCAILEKIRPEIVFLEALEKTYSNYDKVRFTAFGVYHKKLEIKTIQKYGLSSTYKYVPLLDNGLSDSFQKKNDFLCRKNQHKKMLNDFNLLAKEQGFLFLNSAKSIGLQAEMRTFEYRLLLENKLNDAVDDDIDAYENSMLRNIYSYCRNNQFDKAVFLCGVAHRRSIIKKIESLSSKHKIDLNWVIYGNEIV